MSEALSLLKGCKILKICNSVSASQATTTTDIIDIQGYVGCLFICKLGTVVNAAAITMTIQQNTINGSSGMAALSGAQAAIAVASSDSEQSLIVDVARPRERYLRASIVTATQDVEIDSVFAILYGPCNIPVTQPSTVDASAYVVSPAEG